MKILLLDIKTAPNTVYTWGLFKQNIGNGCGGWFRSNKTVSTRREERMANIAA